MTFSVGSRRIFTRRFGRSGSCRCQYPATNTPDVRVTDTQCFCPRTHCACCFCFPPQIRIERGSHVSSHSRTNGSSASSIPSSPPRSLGAHAWPAESYSKLCVIRSLRDGAVCTLIKTACMLHLIFFVNGMGARCFRGRCLVTRSHDGQQPASQP